MLGISYLVPKRRGAYVRSRRTSETGHKVWALLYLELCPIGSTIGSNRDRVQLSLVYFVPIVDYGAGFLTVLNP